MQDIVLVNASPLLHDAELQGFCAALQIQYNRDFKPRWGDQVPDAHFSFAKIADIPRLDPASWPIFFNQHADQPGDLGWHDDSGRIFSRVFVGDCMKDGVSWTVTGSHEALEMALDPNIRRMWRMPDRRLAAFEACDAVEDDRQSYLAGPTYRVSNFVLPKYFSTESGPYDFMGKLAGPCPALTDGGYMSIADANGENMTQIEARHADHTRGRRASREGHRRLIRKSRRTHELEIIQTV